MKCQGIFHDSIFDKVREQQNVYLRIEVLFSLFIFYFENPWYEMEKTRTLLFDENAWELLSFRPSKFFRLDDFEYFFQNFEIFQGK